VTSSADNMLCALRAAVWDPPQVKTRALDLHPNAHDASHFLLVPPDVVVASDAREMGRFLRAASELRPSCVRTMFGLAVDSSLAIQKSFERLSSCTEGLWHTIERDTSDKPMTIIDSVEFARTRPLPHLPDCTKLESLALLRRVHEKADATQRAG